MSAARDTVMSANPLSRLNRNVPSPPLPTPIIAVRPKNSESVDVSFTWGAIIVSLSVAAVVSALVVVVRDSTGPRM